MGLPRGLVQARSSNQSPDRHIRVEGVEFVQGHNSLLEFLHNERETIHHDGKTENILVTRSPSDYGNVIPNVPVFKLGDSSLAQSHMFRSTPTGSCTSGPGRHISHLQYRSVKQIYLHVLRVIRDHSALHYRTSL